VAAPVFRMDSKDFVKVGEIVKDIAQEVTLSLGGESKHGK